jgi:hypothetical protein
MITQRALSPPTPAAGLVSRTQGSSSGSSLRARHVFLFNTFQPLGRALSQRAREKTAVSMGQWPERRRWRRVPPNIRGSKLTGSGSCTTILPYSRWFGLISQLYSVGASTDGTNNAQCFPACTNSFPIRASSGGATGLRQFWGSWLTSIRSRPRSSGISATARTRSAGESPWSR